MSKRVARVVLTMLSTLLVAGVLLGSGIASAAGVVTDPVLKQIIQLSLGLPPAADVTARDVAKLTKLVYSGYAASVSGKIQNLNGLQYAANLKLLDVTDCSVTSLAPVRNLTALKTMVLRNNPVDLRVGSVDYNIAQVLRSRGCLIYYNTPRPSPYLTGIKSSIGTLVPAFRAGVYTFWLELPDTAAGRTVTITPVRADLAAGLFINGYRTNSYTTTLNVGYSKVLTIKVAAKGNYDSRTYTLIVRRPSANNLLSGIRKTAGTLSPSFRSGTLSYVLALPASVSKVTITPVKADSRARILIDGVAASSKTVTVAKGASKTVIITVVAQSGAQRNYRVLVARSN